MSVIIKGNRIDNCGGGISLVGISDAEIDQNIITNTPNAISVRGHENMNVTRVKLRDLEIEIPGQWKLEDVKELLLIAKRDGKLGAIASRTKIGSYLKRKIEDPVQFAAEISSIVGAFGVALQ